MSKKSIKQRDKKKIATLNKYYNLRKYLKKKILNEKNYIIKRKLYFYIQKLPRNSNINRIKKRCPYSGRSRGYVNKFAMSRIILREKINLNQIPGIIKSSW
ncbi:30S ribosomal protein S14 [Candidatus Vidania fulgoroideorum]